MPTMTDETPKTYRRSDAGDDLDAALVAAIDATIPRFQRALRQAIVQAEGDNRLTMPQLRCLQAMAGERRPPLTTHLARQMGVAVPTMTSMIDNLVERGLVERRPDPSSRRQVQLVMTADGYALLDRYQGLMNARLRNLLAHLDRARKGRLLAAVSDIAAMLDTDADHPAAARPDSGGGT